MPKSPVSNAYLCKATPGTARHSAVPQGHENPSASAQGPPRQGAAIIPSASHLLGEEALVLDLVTVWLGVRLSSGMVGRIG